MFVDPITRQTYPFANEENCIGGYKNAYQLDIDNDNSWYHLMPAPVPLQPPKIFSSRVVSSVLKFTGIPTCRNLHTKSTKIFLGQYLAFGSIKASFDKNFKRSSRRKKYRLLSKRYLCVCDGHK